MKQLILTTLFTTIVATGAFAQSSFGIKGGVNFSNLAVDKDQVNDNNYRTRVTAGFVNRNNFGGFGFQSELLYTQKGAKYDLSGATVKANLDYIEIPLSLQVKILNSPLSVYAGGYGAYLVNAKYEYEINNQQRAEYDDKDAFNKFDYGVLAGANLNLGGFLLDGRFTRGLRNVEEKNQVIGASTFIPNDTKNFGFQVTATIMLK